VPADAVTAVVPDLHLVPGQAVIDATNAVRMPVPGGHTTMGDLVSSLVPAGVSVAKAFNTVGAEHLTDGRTAQGRVFLPIAGDSEAVDIATTLASDLGFEVVALGGRERFGMVEDHARLWIHLAFGCGWGRDFAFTVTRS
jgi:predicted dinucleotide-binding enzyme